MSAAEKRNIAGGGSHSILVADGLDEVALIDSGGGRKLERLGAVTVDRPEPQAMWRRAADDGTWDAADAVFAGDDEANDQGAGQGRWKHNGKPSPPWPVQLMGLTAVCRFTSFRHLGIFPEQVPHWRWMEQRLQGTGGRPAVLNLFGYTGIASLLAARAGAQVTHVDASKKAVQWARENQGASGFDDLPIRWIVDDARKFAAREVRRGRRYQGILIDPPKFGRGPNGEVWELFDHLPALIADCAEVLERENAFLILTSYAVRASFLAFEGLVREALAGHGGGIDSGELAVREASAGRLLPTSMFVRWNSTSA